MSRWFDYCYPRDKSIYRAIAHIQPLLHVLQLPDDPIRYLREAMLALMGPSRQAASTPQICIMPGAGGGEHKKWGIENYWKLVTLIHEHHPTVHFNFVLGPDDAAEIEFLENQQSTLPFHVQKNLSLKELVALTENSLLTIANDCGPSHVSQCLVKPFIGLYYKPNPEWFLPHPLSRSFSPPDENIKNIFINDVLVASLELLAKQHARHDRSNISSS